MQPRAHRGAESLREAIDPRAEVVLARHTISAAADGVGARRSATKSAM
jgi:hypothetical protein